MSNSKATTSRIYSFHTGRKEGREEPLFSSPDIFLIAVHSRLNFKISDIQGSQKQTSHKIQARPCHIPCKYLSILDIFSGLMGFKSSPCREIRLTKLSHCDTCLYTNIFTIFTKEPQIIRNNNELFL